MTTIFKPDALQARRKKAEDVRHRAAKDATQAAIDLAEQVTGQLRNGTMPILSPTNNGEEEKYAGTERHFTNFTKGLAHDDDGFIRHDADFVEFAKSIRDDTLTDKVGDLNSKLHIGDRLGHQDDGELIWRYYDQAREVYNAPHDETPKAVTQGKKVNFDLSKKNAAAQHRRWEAPTAGVVFDLEGPDPYATYMPPAPTVVEGTGEHASANPELVAEMAEIYWLALLRDTPFRAFDTVTMHDGTASEDVDRVQQAVDYIKMLDFYKGGHGNNAVGKRQRRTGPDGLDRNSIFRGQTAGDVTGPFLSQFLLLGTPGRDGGHEFSEADYTDGMVSYGAIRMDMKVRQSVPHKDYMTHWNEWLDVQNGANVGGAMQTYVSRDRANSYRFIATPRDLATYVHFDALYEAYLNACIIMMEMGAPTDPDFAALNHSETVDGFALFGGPHILTLVTEVATRALKAVRFQKYNVHMRARPEVLAARIAYRLRSNAHAGQMPRFHHDIGLLASALDQPVDVGYGEPVNLLQKVAAHNAEQNLRHNPYLQGQSGLAGCTDLPLLPMAFSEGSPMHPSYGAGHATVAGACVTMLKAFFDTSCLMVWDNKDADDSTKDAENDKRRIKFILPADYEDDHCGRYTPVAFVPSADGLKLDDVGYKLERPLTLEDELNKLAANISIARNMAGVHYYSDYIDSLRMGEHVALQILEQQAFTYCNDAFCFNAPKFDEVAGDEAQSTASICAPKITPTAELLDKQLLAV